MIQHTQVKPAFHASMLSTLSKCGIQFEHRYIHGRKVPPGVALVVGTATHKACEFDAIHKMKHGKPAALDDVKQVAAESLDATWLGEEPMLDDEEKSRGASTIRAESKDTVVSLAAVANQARTPFLQPVAIEKKIRLTLDAFPFDLEGTIDLLELRTRDGVVRKKITDIKTAARSPSGDEAQRHPQLDLYTMLELHESGVAVDDVGLDFLVKTKVPKFVQVEEPAQRDFTAIKMRVEAAANVVEKGAFYPVDPTGPNAWVCTPKFCGYFDECVYGRGKRVQI